MKDLGKRMKQVRKDKNMTQRELAKRTGIPQSSISLYEKNVREPSLFSFLLIADALEVSADSLLGREVAKKCR